MIVMYHFLVKSLCFSFVIIIILAERKAHIRGCYFFPFLGNSDSVIKTGRSPVYNVVLPVMYNVSVWHALLVFSYFCFLLQTRFWDKFCHEFAYCLNFMRLIFFSSKA